MEYTILKGSLWTDLQGLNHLCFWETPTQSMLQQHYLPTTYPTYLPLPLSILMHIITHHLLAPTNSNIGRCPQSHLVQSNNAIYNSWFSKRGDTSGN